MAVLILNTLPPDHAYSINESAWSPSCIPPPVLDPSRCGAEDKRGRATSGERTADAGTWGIDRSVELSPDPVVPLARS